MHSLQPPPAYHKHGPALPQLAGVLYSLGSGSIIGAPGEVVIMLLKRLRYVSQFRQDFTRPELDELVRQAAGKNRGLGITGILMTSGRLFFQIIEGPPAAIDRLYETICADDRHKDVLLLGVEPDASARLFPDWSMRRMDLDRDSDERLAATRELLVSIHAQRLALERQTLELEKVVFSELASLMQ